MAEDKCLIPAREVALMAEVDVAVVGGFPGVVAAVAAARLGVTVARRRTIPTSIRMLSDMSCRPWWMNTVSTPLWRRPCRM